LDLLTKEFLALVNKGFWLLRAAFRRLISDHLSQLDRLRVDFLTSLRVDSKPQQNVAVWLSTTR